MGRYGPLFSATFGVYSTPAVLEAYKTLKNPKKVAKLDVSTRTFQASTNVEVPAPLLHSHYTPDTVKSDDIKAVIQHYHDTSVQPSIELPSKHIRGRLPLAPMSLHGTPHHWTWMAGNSDCPHCQGFAESQPRCWNVSCRPKDIGYQSSLQEIQLSWSLTRVRMMLSAPNRQLPANAPGWRLQS